MRKKASPKPSLKKADLFIFAGESSGDVHGKELIDHLLKTDPDLQISGVGGPRMRKTKMEIWMEMENFQVIGFIDLLFSLFRIAKHFFFLRKKIIKENPPVCLFIDYPGFNLRLEQSLRKKGYTGKLIHYISPTVWAWKKGRVWQMEKSLDLLMTILPFEKECYEKTSLPVEYVGHPLVKIIAKEKKLLPLTFFKKKHLIGIFPGSRKKELFRNLPLQLKAAEALLAIDNKVHFVLSISDKNDTPFILSLIEKTSIPKSKIEFSYFWQNYSFMSEMKMAIATSGTINLELALFEVPTLVTYGITKIDLFLIQKVFHVSLPHYCLVNIIAKKEIFPELYGPNFTKEHLIKEAVSLYSDPEAMNDMIDGCKQVKKILGDKDASKNASNLVYTLFEEERKKRICEEENQYLSS